MALKREKMLGNKVLHIGPKFNPPQGGIAQTLYNYKNFIFGENFKFIGNSCPGTKITKILFLLKSIITFWVKLSFDRNINIVHIHTASRLSFKRSVWFMSMSKILHKKVIMHIHGGGFKDYYEKGCKSFVSKNLKRCDIVIALSENWKSTFEEDLGLRNIRVLENLIPKPTKLDTVDDGKLHVLFLGLLSKEKGLYDLIEAVRTGHEKWQNKLVLHIGGNGDSKSFLREIAGLSDIICFEGWVTGQKKIDLLNLCKIFVLPSYTEGLPLSILEAMSYGMTIVATPVGAIPSIVKDKENGLLIPQGSPQAIENAFDLLLSSPLMVSQLGKKSETLIEPFLPTNVRERLMQIYFSLLD